MESANSASEAGRLPVSEGIQAESTPPNPPAATVPPVPGVAPAVPGPSAAAAFVIPDLLRADPSTRGILQRIALAVGGAVLIVVGFIGWVLPVVPGVPLVILGLVMLGMCSQRVAGHINRAEARLPESWRLFLRPGLKKPEPIPVARALEHPEQLSNEELLAVLLGRVQGGRNEPTDRK